MAQSNHDRQVDYIEFGATDQGFGWRFEDYGPD